MTQGGRCHCGCIRYELNCGLPATVNCHCRDCRRVHGAAFVTTAPISTKDLRIVTGEDRIRKHGQRYFCAECGTRLWNRLDDRPGATLLMVATLDREPSAAPAVHVNIESKAPWYSISDDRPVFKQLPPESEKFLESFDGKD